MILLSKLSKGLAPGAWFCTVAAADLLRPEQVEVALEVTEVLLLASSRGVMFLHLP